MLEQNNTKISFSDDTQQNVDKYLSSDQQIPGRIAIANDTGRMYLSLKTNSYIPLNAAYYEKLDGGSYLIKFNTPVNIGDIITVNEADVTLTRTAGIELTDNSIMTKSNVIDYVNNYNFDLGIVGRQMRQEENENELISEIFNYITDDEINNNRAYGNRSSARGENTLAGTNIFSIGSIENNIIILEDNDYNEQLNTISSVQQPIIIWADKIYYNILSTIDENNGIYTFILPEDILPSLKEGLNYLSLINYPELGVSYTSDQGLYTVIGQAASTDGLNTKALGPASRAIGIDTLAFSKASLAQGIRTQAGGIASLALGENTKALGDNSLSQGLLTRAEGKNSTAFGSNTQAIGNNSVAIGLNTQANYEGELVIGQNNQLDTDTLFVVGNGTKEIPSNAFVVYNDGKIAANSLYIYDCYGKEGWAINEEYLSTYIKNNFVTPETAGLLENNYLTIQDAAEKYATNYAIGRIIDYIISLDKRTPTIPTFITSSYCPPDKDPESWDGDLYSSQWELIDQEFAYHTEQYGFKKEHANHANTDIAIDENTIDFYQFNIKRFGHQVEIEGVFFSEKTFNDNGISGLFKINHKILGIVNKNFIWNPNFTILEESGPVDLNFKNSISNDPLQTLGQKIFAYSDLGNGALVLSLSEIIPKEEDTITDYQLAINQNDILSKGAQYIKLDKTIYFPNSVISDDMLTNEMFEDINWQQGFKFNIILNLKPEEMRSDCCNKFYWHIKETIE